MKELIPGRTSDENDISHQVFMEQRAEYVEKAFQARIGESSAQIEAMRRGITSVIPIQVLELWTSKQFEQEVCGIQEITIEGLKENLTYDMDSSVTNWTITV